MGARFAQCTPCARHSFAAAIRSASTRPISTATGTWTCRLRHRLIWTALWSITFRSARFGVCAGRRRSAGNCEEPWRTTTWCICIPFSYGRHTVPRVLPAARGVPYMMSPRGMLVRDVIRAKSRLAKSAWIELVERRSLSQAARVHVTAEIEEVEARALGLRLPETFCVPNGVSWPSRHSRLAPVRLPIFRGRTRCF